MCLQAGDQSFIDMQGISKDGPEYLLLARQSTQSLSKLLIEVYVIIYRKEGDYFIMVRNLKGRGKAHQQHFAGRQDS